jgi:hypothetical protein
MTPVLLHEWLHDTYDLIAHAGDSLGNTSVNCSFRITFDAQVTHALPAVRACSPALVYPLLAQRVHATQHNASAMIGRSAWCKWCVPMLRPISSLLGGQYIGPCNTFCTTPDHGDRAEWHRYKELLSPRPSSNCHPRASPRAKPRVAPRYFHTQSSISTSWLIMLAFQQSCSCSGRFWDSLDDPSVQVLPPSHLTFLASLLDRHSSWQRAYDGCCQLPMSSVSRWFLDSANSSLRRRWAWLGQTCSIAGLLGTSRSQST